MTIKTKILKSSHEQTVAQSFSQLLTRLDRYPILRMNVYFTAPDNQVYERTREQFRTILKSNNREALPVNYIAQAPLDCALALEVEYMEAGCPEYKQYKHVHYSKIQQGKYKALHLAGLQSDLHLSIREQAHQCLALLQEILDIEQMSIDTIVRQWNYIADIVAVDDAVQHYQIFNDARSSLYHSGQWQNGYPAATGIGMQSGGILVSAVAAEGMDELTPLSNPEQLDAHSYSQQVLVGNGDREHKQKTTPKFERGKLLKITSQSKSHAFISGTASIIGEKTIYVGDVEAQTLQTLNNIKSVLHPSYSHFSPLHLIVYVKRDKDFKKVQDTCLKYHKKTPTLYVLADVCREDLLVEIESLYTE